MFFLRQSTASQNHSLGPFIDDTDGKTLETALTINNTDIRLIKAGGASVTKNSGGATHDSNGRYLLTYDATDSDTVGDLVVSCKISGALIVEQYYQVLEEKVYDALFATNAVGELDVNLAKINSVADAAARLSDSTSQIVSAAVETTTTASTTTQFNTTLTVDEYFEGRTLIFTSGALKRLPVKITAASLDNAELRFTVEDHQGAAMPVAPSDGDTFIIV